MSIDVSAELRREVRIAAARRDQSLRDYVIEALTAQLRQDRAAEQERAAIHGASDPVLTELWDNPADAVYDQLEPRPEPR